MSNFKILVSDLHMSGGHAAEGNALEDFNNDAEFAALLNDTIAESARDNAEVELIFAGDSFDMLQIPHVDTFDPAVVYPPEKYHSSSESDSVRKIDIAISGHPLVFGALAGFVQPGPPRRSITFVKGNHDINLHWPAVQARIAQAVGAVDGRASLLAFEERCVSREGIYVEHGNQYGDFLSKVDDPEEPHDPEHPGQLKVPPGSWFVMNAFNRVERERYWIDGVKPLASLIWYALAYDFKFAAWAIAELIRALPGSVHSAVLDTQDSPNALAEQLEDPAQVRTLSTQYEADPAFRQQFNADVARVLAPMPSAGVMDVEPPAASPDPAAMGDRARAEMRSSLYEVARRRAVEEGAQVVVFGHTHEPSSEDLPGGGRYINSGTWTWSADFTGADKKTWRDLFEHPERFTNDRRLTYVRVDYAAGQAGGQLLVYRPKQNPPPPPPKSFLQRLLGFFRDAWRLIFGG